VFVYFLAYAALEACLATVSFLVIVCMLISSSCCDNNTEFKGPVILFCCARNIQIVDGRLTTHRPKMILKSLIEPLNAASV
jgi:hypothetical protein